MTSQGTAHGRFPSAISSRNLQNAEMAAREMGGLPHSSRAHVVLRTAGRARRVLQAARPSLRRATSHSCARSEAPGAWSCEWNVALPLGFLVVIGEETIG
jgi:hypothetical protein